jgi:hypothetical protein
LWGIDPSLAMAMEMAMSLLVAQPSIDDNGNVFICGASIDRSTDGNDYGVCVVAGTP